MKILFLEPFNVLNSKEFRTELLKMNNGRNYDNFIRYEFESSKVKLIKKILDDTGTKMVLYTKDRCCSQKIGALLKKLKQFGLSDTYWFDTIPNNDPDIYKSQTQWIINKSHLNIENFVIVDNKINHQTPESAKNIFWIEDDGLTEDIASQIISFLS